MRVAIVGVGGVGSFAAEVLARAGIPLTLVDFDSYQPKNRNQRFYRSLYEKAYKAEVIAAELEEFTDVKPIVSDVDNADLKGNSFLLDCTDSRESRLKAFQKAKELHLPYGFSSISNDVGMTSIVLPEQDFSLLDKEGSTSSGGPAACALAGSLAAANTLSFLNNSTAIIWPEVLVFNSSKMVFEKVIL